MMLEQCRDTARVLVLPAFGRGGFIEGATQQQGDDRCGSTDHEGDAPAVVTQLFGGQELLEDDHGQHRQQLPADQSHVLKRSIKATLATQRYFTHVSGRGAVLATHRQALQQARHQQQGRRPGANRCIGRQAGNDQ